MGKKDKDEDKGKDDGKKGGGRGGRGDGRDPDRLKGKSWKEIQDELKNNRNNPRAAVNNSGNLQRCPNCPGDGVIPATKARPARKCTCENGWIVGRTR